MRVLITGGAGYIGSFTYRALRARGIPSVILDNLSRGHRKAVPADALLIEADLESKEPLVSVLSSHRVDAVLHFAGLIEVAESVRDPLLYYRGNVTGTLNLLEAMKATGVRRLVYSSSAAVYGNPAEAPIGEEHLLEPVNPYGWSKAMVERILRDCAKSWGLNSVSLRYFNAAGGAPDGTMGEDHPTETHLIPLVLRAALGIPEGAPPLRIFGTNYDTPDGTCVRDYIHVLDLADAHVSALEWMESHEGAEAYNVGNEQGFSVLEILRVCEDVSGVSIPAEKAPPRPGDPPRLVASARKIRRELGWSPRFPDIHEIVDSAWRWHLSHPYGYGD